MEVAARKRLHRGWGIGLRSGSEPRIFPEKAASGTSEKLSPRAAGAYSFVLSRPSVALPINKTLVDGELG